MVVALSKETARNILKAMKNTGPSGMAPGSFLSENGEVGGGFVESNMYDIGGCIRLDFQLDSMDYEETYEFEPDFKPRNYAECAKACRDELKRIIDDIFSE